MKNGLASLPPGDPINVGRVVADMPQKVELKTAHSFNIPKGPMKGESMAVRPPLPRKQ